MQHLIEIVEIRHFHLFCGLGGGARGFNRGRASVGPLRARFRCLGGVDVSPAAIADFERLAGVHGTVLDMMDRDQFREFHGHEPGPAWRERIGNAVPPPASQAIAGVMGETLLLAWSGETFSMSSTPVWVAPVVAALAVETMEVPHAS